jgi:hypothetical protein
MGGDSVVLGYAFMALQAADAPIVVALAYFSIPELSEHP